MLTEKVILASDCSEFRDLLSSLAPSGGRYPSNRNGLNRLGAVKENDDRYRLSCRHFQRGSFDLLLKGVKAAGDWYGIYSPSEEQAIESALNNPLVISKLPAGGYSLEFSHRGIFGYSGGSLLAEDIEITKLSSAEEIPPGACQACGSVKMTIRLSLNFEIEMTDEAKARWDGEGRLGNYLALAHCSGCGTEQAQMLRIGSFTNGLEINGAKLDDANLASFSAGTSLREAQGGSR